MAYLDDIRMFQQSKNEQFIQIIESNLDSLSDVLEQQDLFECIEESIEEGKDITDIEDSEMEQILEFLTPFKGGGIQIQATIDKLTKKYPQSFGMLVGNLKTLTGKAGMIKDGRGVQAIINTGIKQGMAVSGRLSANEKEDGFDQWLEAVRISTKKATVGEVRNIIIAGLTSYYVGMGLLNGSGFATSLLGRIGQAMKVGSANLRNKVAGAIEQGAQTVGDKLQTGAKSAGSALGVR